MTRDAAAGLHGGAPLTARNAPPTAGPTMCGPNARTTMALRILIVDDCPDTPRVLTKLLADEPLVEVVGCAGSYRGALALIQREAPDVVLMDVGLGRRDRGHELLRDVRRLRPHLAVVMFADGDRSALRPAFIEVGASAWFEKVTEFGQAVDWVRRHAQRAQAQA